MGYTLSNYKYLAKSPRTNAYRCALKEEYDKDRNAVLLDLGTGSVMCFSVIGKSIGFKKIIALEKCTKSYRHAKRYYASSFENLTFFNIDVFQLDRSHVKECFGRRVVVVHEFFDNLASAENAHILLKHVSNVLSSLGISYVCVPPAASTIIIPTDLSFDDVNHINNDTPRINILFGMKNTGYCCIDYVNKRCKNCPRLELERLDFIQSTHHCPEILIRQTCKNIVVQLCINFESHSYTISDRDTWQQVILDCSKLQFPLSVQLSILYYTEEHPVYMLRLNDERIRLDSNIAWSHIV